MPYQRLRPAVFAHVGPRVLKRDAIDRRIGPGPDPDWDMNRALVRDMARSDRILSKRVQCLGVWTQDQLKHLRP
eukprot:12170934-Alexandrium_andersonii.AAC.1